MTYNLHLTIDTEDWSAKIAATMGASPIKRLRAFGQFCNDAEFKHFQVGDSPEAFSGNLALFVDRHWLSAEHYLLKQGFEKTRDAKLGVLFFLPGFEVHEDVIHVNLCPGVDVFDELWSRQRTGSNMPDCVRLELESSESSLADAMLFWNSRKSERLFVVGIEFYFSGASCSGQDENFGE